LGHNPHVGTVYTTTTSQVDTSSAASSAAEDSWEEQRSLRRRSVEMTLDARLQQRQEGGSRTSGTSPSRRAKLVICPIVHHGIPQSTRVLCVASFERLDGAAWVIGYESGLLLLNAELDVLCWTRMADPVVSVRPLSGDAILVETQFHNRNSTGSTSPSVFECAKRFTDDVCTKYPRSPNRMRRQWNSSPRNTRQSIYGADLQLCNTSFPTQCITLATDGGIVVLSHGMDRLLLHDTCTGVRIVVTHNAAGPASSACFTPAGFLTLHADGAVLAWELPISDIEPAARRRIDADVQHIRYASGHVVGLGVTGTLYLYDQDASHLLFCHVTHAGVALTGVVASGVGLICCDAAGRLVPVDLGRSTGRALL
jgi:hypothetical protein